MSTVTILDKIINRKQQEIVERKLDRSFTQLESLIPQLASCRGFIEALEKQIRQKRPAVIAEIKKASPSKGLIRKDFNPEAIARSYSENGASCLSVLTDVDFFQGHDDYLIAARNACKLPVIRKDFIVDTYQIAESRVLGADCILLIVAALDKVQLKELYDYARQLQLDVLVEVHNQAELEVALSLNASLVGINNRDLHTFKTSLNTTFELLNNIPEGTSVVTESGILVREDVEEMLAHHVYGFLIGESFMRAPDPGQKLKELFFHG